MDTILQTFFSWQFLMLCLGIAAITSFIRRYIDFAIKLRDSKRAPEAAKTQSMLSYFWQEVVLPTFPVALGGIITAYVSKYPFPEDIKTLSGRVFFGMVAGMLSTLVYRVAKSVLVGWIKPPPANVNLEEEQK